MKLEKSPDPNQFAVAIIWLISIVAAYYLLTDIDILHQDIPFLQMVITMSATISGIYFLIITGITTVRRYLGKLSNK